MSRVLERSAVWTLLLVVSTALAVGSFVNVALSVAVDRFSLLDWVLFGIGVASSLIGVARGLWLYASRSALSRWVPKQAPADRLLGAGAARARIGDDLLWVTLVVAVAALTVLNGVAIAEGISLFFDEDHPALVWVAYQLAVLSFFGRYCVLLTTKALRGLCNRAARPRRDQVREIFERFMRWPVPARTRSASTISLGTSTAAIATTAAAAVAATISFGPLLEPRGAEPIAAGPSAATGASAQPPRERDGDRGRPHGTRPRRRVKASQARARGVPLSAAPTSSPSTRPLALRLPQPPPSITRPSAPGARRSLLARGALPRRLGAITLSGHNPATHTVTVTSVRGRWTYSLLLAARSGLGERTSAGSTPLPASAPSSTSALQRTIVLGAKTRSIATSSPGSRACCQTMADCIYRRWCTGAT